MKIYVTKYAISSGIRETEAESTNHKGMVKELGCRWDTYYHAPEYATTLEAAKAKVIEMITAKRKSIAKQLAKLDKLEKSLDTPSPAQPAEEK